MAAHCSYAEDKLGIAIGDAGPTLRHVTSGLVIEHLTVIECSFDICRRKRAIGAEIVVRVVAAQIPILVGWGSPYSAVSISANGIVKSIAVSMMSASRPRR